MGKQLNLVPGPPIRVITTGGTIDKDYNRVDGRNTFIGDSNIPRMIEQGENMAPIEISSPIAKDSLDFTARDRKLIVTTCVNAPEKAIVITHGTDTMVETAAVIAKEELDKTIVLTGAARPFSFGESDAIANFSGALIAAQLAPHGVYICMNGLVFPWDKAQKDFEHGWFVSTESGKEKL